MPGQTCPPVPGWVAVAVAPPRNYCCQPAVPLTAPVRPEARGNGVTAAHRPSVPFRSVPVRVGGKAKPTWDAVSSAYSLADDSDRFGRDGGP